MTQYESLQDPFHIIAKNILALPRQSVSRIFYHYYEAKKVQVLTNFVKFQFSLLIFKENSRHFPYREQELSTFNVLQV